MRRFTTGLVLLVASTAGCGGNPAPRRSAPALAAVGAASSARSGVQSEPRLFVLPELAGPGLVFATQPDGSRQLIVRGVRVVDRPDGSMDQARELLPSGRALKPLELPGRLGQGFVFGVDTSGGTQLYRAPSWTGALSGVATLDFDVESMVAGFDRLYLSERPTLAVNALSLSSGKFTDLGALPPSPSFIAMGFVNEWFGAVEVPFRGVLASFDAGASWHPLPGARGLALEGEELRVRLGAGQHVLDAGGALRRTPAPPARTAEEAPQRVSPRTVGRRPLREAVLRGVPDGAERALVAEGGALARVRLSDGKLLEVNERAYAAGAACQGIELGAGHGFVCSEPRGTTLVYRVVSGLTLEPVFRFDGPRFVAASGSGALVVRGGCDSAAARAGRYCVISEHLRARDVRVTGATGHERVIARTDGTLVVLEPPRGKQRGALRFIAPNGREQRRVLQLPRASPARLTLLRSGLWLDGFREETPGRFTGWVVGAGPFAGVRVHADGRVEMGVLQDDIGQALLAGRHALLFGQSGVAAETRDNGFRWSTIELPGELADDDSEPVENAKPARTEQGCSELGCAFGPWLRVGWSSSSKAAAAEALNPPLATRPSPGGGRWSLGCVPADTLEPKLRASDEDVASGARRRLFAIGRGWPDPFSVLAPARPSAGAFVHAGTEQKAVQLHAYAWGPAGSDWSRTARWQVMVADPFAVRGSWSTAPTRTPWADDATSVLAFGADPNSTAVNWEAMLDPLANAGALVITARGTLELFLFEEERGIIVVRDAARHGYFSLAGVVKLGSDWYVGMQSGSSELRVLKLEGDRLRVIGEYALPGARTWMRATLVRSSRGDALGIWARSRGWFVFPLDAKDGSIGAPLEITPEQLARVPSACAADADGWLLQTAPSDTGRDLLSPNLDLGSAQARNVEARLLASAFELCLHGLAAQSDVAPPIAQRAAAAPKKSFVPLVVSERRVGGRRWGYRCAP